MRRKIAVIGSGISGIASAWLLAKTHCVTVFEAADYLGGHTHTVDIKVEGRTFPVDTGFLVCNRRTYPNLIPLFEHLGVELVPSDMTFAVSMNNPALEWSGASLATLFAQKRNLLRPGFFRMIQDILRFNRETTGETTGALPEGTLGDYLDARRYSKEFRDWYLLPMAAAIWSCPTQTMLAYPLLTFVRFCRNHGLLQIADRPQWLTVKGGGREYVKRMAAKINDIRLNCPVSAVLPKADGRGATLKVGAGGTGQSTGQTSAEEATAQLLDFDEVILACHSDQALMLLGAAASDAERQVLSAIRYQSNRAVLHTDRNLLPRDKRIWSAWNYLAGDSLLEAAPGSNVRSAGAQSVSVSYLINHLQPLPVNTPVVLSLNPLREPDPAHVLAEFDYAHPVFDQAAIDAQAALPALQGQRGLWFCGAWTGYGFHEDGLRSALAVANALGGRAPWQAAATRAVIGEVAMA